MQIGFPSAPVRSSKASKRLTMVKSSILKVLLGSLLGSLPAMISVAQAAEPETAPFVGNTPAVDSQPGLITVDQAPDVDLPPRIAADVRAAIEDALAGRAAPAVPIDITLEAGGVVVRVGSLWRRIAIARWDYPAVRTVALHVLDLLQPAPEVSEVASGPPVPGPAATVVAQATANDHATESAGPWSLHAGIAGARGAEGPDPWMASFTAGAAWTHHDWLRIALELGWDHAVVRHPDGLTTVNYDATPLRLVVAAQNSKLVAGVRAGAAWYRVTGEQPYREVTPLVGPFIAAPVPIVGRFRGLLMAGFDYFARRTMLLAGGIDPAYSTPQVAFYVGVIIEGGLRP
jgi:hypothetical protein